jgi:hypothetical protein
LLKRPVFRDFNLFSDIVVNFFTFHYKASDESVGP